MMKRRDFLTQMALLPLAGQAFLIESAKGAPVPIDTLRRALDPREATVLVPTDSNFRNYQGAFNKLKILKPQVRVICNTPNAVQIALAWAIQNNVPLAMRAGGHSYEGFSQTKGLVIDVRTMTALNMGPNNETFTVGAGALLGRVYETIAAHGVVIPAGSCPTVGVTGHSTGGGYGLIARGFGLASDSILSFDMVLADGRFVHVDENNHPDLYWACRGAGGGNFGVITQLQFRAHRVRSVLKFGIGWLVNERDAAKLAVAWQHWAPEAPNGINALMKVRKRTDGRIEFRCFGQSIGQELALSNELQHLTGVVRGGKISIKKMPFLGAVREFGGKETNEVSVFMKAKSDYVKRHWTQFEAEDFMARLPLGEVIVVFDAYGGAIRNLRDDETAFAHRENTISSVQYYSDWSDFGETQAKLRTLKNFHDSVRPHFSGYAYSNYPDLDLPNYAEAYWAGNLDRLISIKNQYDPRNVFQHAQSVPLRRS